MALSLDFSHHGHVVHLAYDTQGLQVRLSCLSHGAA